ncbi:hypothetical protein AVEN_109866-1, partial [Araneus ventricosus]
PYMPVHPSDDTESVIHRRWLRFDKHWRITAGTAVQLSDFWSMVRRWNRCCDHPSVSELYTQQTKFGDLSFRQSSIYKLI